MEIQFLGTSSGAPTNRRNVSAIALVESKGKAWYLIDCGEGTQHQLLKSHVSLNNLKAIFITHLHGDHFYGLPGVLASAGLNGRTKALKIVAPKGAQEWITLTTEVSQLHLPYELEFIETVAGELGGFGQFNVSALTLAHRITSYGYVFVENKEHTSIDMNKLEANRIPKGPLWGQIRRGEDIVHEGMTYSAHEFLISTNEARKVIICGDNDNPELLASACKGCNLLIHESTFTEGMADRAKAVGHSYAKLIASFAEKSKVPNLVLTHLSARYANGDAIREEALSVYSGSLHVANDFDRIILDKRGIFSLVESTDS